MSKSVCIEEEINIKDTYSVHSTETTVRFPTLTYRPNDPENGSYLRNRPEDEEGIVGIGQSREQFTEIIEEDPLDRQMSMTYPPKNLYRFFTCCCWSFFAGFQEGVVGVLLPYIQMQFHLTYSLSALVWLSTALGYVTVAALSSQIEKRMGKKSIVLACLSATLMSVIIAPGKYYPLIVVGYFFGGAGVGICVGQLNVFISRFENSSAALGYIHGMYGLGASVSPLVATAFVSAGIKWHLFYIILGGGMFLNAINAYFAFVVGEEELKQFELRDISRDRALQKDSPEPTEQDKSGLMKAALKNKVTWINSLFIFFYQGGEVALGGWLTTYLRDYRNHKQASIGYVTSGFWFGLTIGRLLLTSNIHKWIGARRGNTIAALLSIVFVTLTWVVPVLGVEIACITIAGIALGPIYPLMITYVASEGLIPRKIQVVSLTITSAFGSSGGAIFPFFVGLISQFKGAFIVFPSFIVMYSLMLLLWIALPNTRYSRKAERSEILNFLHRIW